ncbi:hypothetical protein EV700_1493 [Fluviicoccus keumensis]|uniref:Uncharacterized protein n=1 Tax=Fluviicoccus keumensis TaxID=1435465 RepID=A0A4Q7Z9A0_9GAMM|nr:hypothetical protein [Fluviicoccus keumensis]RZU47102.1 hypothetical protein EV700_1493 [Fluviicoccus keumensis]
MRPLALINDPIEWPVSLINDKALVIPGNIHYNNQRICYSSANVGRAIFLKNSPHLPLYFPVFFA